MPHTLRAFNVLEAKSSWIRDSIGNPSSMLYIGWTGGSHPWWHRKFCPDLGVSRVGVLEIYTPNFNQLAAEAKGGLFSEVKEYELIHGDAREIDKFVQKDRFDIVFWDHGPEHVSWEELQEASKRIFDIAGRMVIYCCPWGKWPQDALGGNESEIHRFDVLPDHFSKLGMKVDMTGGCNQEKEGELIGYRFVKEYERLNSP